MIERIFIPMQTAWTSGIIGKLKVVGGAYLALLGVAVIMATAIYWGVKVDRRYARRYRKTGTVMKKYLELSDECRSYEVKDSPEARKKGACFVIDVWCSREASFRQLIQEDLYDMLREGEQLPVEYAVGRMFGGVRLIKMPVSAWEWETYIDEMVEMAQ